MKQSYRFNEGGVYRKTTLNVIKLTPRVHVVLPRTLPPKSAGQVKARKDFPNGTVIILRGRGDQPVPQKFADVYSAIRSRTLARVNYGATPYPGEEDKTRTMIEEARSNLRILTDRDQFDLFERSQVHARLIELSAGLEKKRNMWKEAAYELIDAASDRTDMLCRHNPGVKAVQVRHGMENLELRLLEIPQILSFLNQDEEALIREREAHIALCRKVLSHYDRVLRAPLFQHPKRYTELGARGFNDWADKREAQVRHLKLAPFTKTRYHILMDMEVARVLASRHDWENVGKVFDRIKNSLMLRLIQPRLEEVLLKVSAMIEIMKNDPEWGLEFANERRHALGDFLNDYRYYIKLNVDESGFRRPVLKPFLTNLEKAARHISWSGHDPKGVKVRQELNSAKRNLKAALIVL
jgi:hypothetical protein